MSDPNPQEVSPGGSPTDTPKNELENETKNPTGDATESQMQNKNDENQLESSQENPYESSIDKHHEINLENSHEVSLENSQEISLENSQEIKHENQTVIEHENQTVIEHENQTVIEHENQSVIQQENSQIIQHETTPVIQHENQPEVLHDINQRKNYLTEENSSSASTPEPQPSREAKYSVIRLEKLITRNDDNQLINDQLYQITSITLSSGIRHTVLRTLHEFQFLDQQLFRSGQCLSGYIIPPFPQEPKIEPVYDVNSGRQLPGYGNFVPLENQLFNWLRLVLIHPVFGHSGLIEPFLCEKDLPPPGKIRKPGLIKHIQDTFDSRKYAHKDCDNFFHVERDWSNRAHDLMSQATETFNSTINAKHSLTHVLAHLSAALSVPIGDNRGINKIALRINLAFSKVLDGYREFVEADTINGSTTLGATLHLWTQYIEAEKEMLNQRTCLLVDYESANRMFDKARNNHSRRPEALNAKQAAEKAFENCSEIARKEIKRFQEIRLTDFAQSLQAYRASQLALAKDHYEKLSQLYRQCTSEMQDI